MTAGQLLVPTVKDLIGILFVILLLSNRNVRKTIPKRTALMAALLWLVLCYPLAKTEYKLEKYLYAQNYVYGYEDIEDKLYMWTKENGIKVAVSFKDDPDTYHYFYSDVQESFGSSEDKSFRYHRISVHRDMETKLLTHRVLSYRGEG